MRNLPTTLWIAAAFAVAVLTAGIPSQLSAAEPAAMSHTIEIKKFKFHPDKLEVSLGDKIVWINRDIVPHTATANDKSWDSKLIAKDAKWETVVNADMLENYFCRFHPNMKGGVSIVVK